jgi:ankyrin repeat protein
MSMTARRPPAIIELAGCGQIEAVRELINKGYDRNGRKVDVNEEDYCGSCAVIEAIDSNDLEMLKVLVDEGGAKLDVKDHMGCPALSRAKQLKHYEVAEWIEQKLAEKKNAASSSQEPNATATISSTGASGLFSKKQDKEKDECKENQSTTPEQPATPSKQSPPIIGF